jgi:hypothetical protein
MQSTKMGKRKKRPNKQVALKHANREKEDQKKFRKGMMTKTKGNFKT